MIVEKAKGGWFDPLREHAIDFFGSKEAASAAILAHRKASREILERTEVFVITLGQNESWMDKTSDMSWARKPPHELLAAEPGRFTVSEPSYEENLKSMEHVISRLVSVNPEMKFILTVSPVAAGATFGDADVITQSFANKCLLRTVVQKIQTLHKDRVFYFPSFEIALAYNPYSFRSDNRHVKFKSVDRIFRVFESSFT